MGLRSSNSIKNTKLSIYYHAGRNLCLQYWIQARIWRCGSSAAFSSIRKAFQKPMTNLALKKPLFQDSVILKCLTSNVHSTQQYHHLQKKFTELTVELALPFYTWPKATTWCKWVLAPKPMNKDAFSTACNSYGWIIYQRKLQTAIGMVSEKMIRISSVDWSLWGSGLVRKQSILLPVSQYYGCCALKGSSENFLWSRERCSHVTISFSVLLLRPTELPYSQTYLS